MLVNEIELLVHVHGRPITEYPHDGKIFIEGRAGSEYEIEVRNHTWHRMETVLSVDGLSVIDGKPAGNQSSGYLIGARNSIRIPGWMLNSATIAKFAFAGKQSSYATQMTGDARNNGVIGAMVFREKLDPPPYHHLGIMTSASRGIGASYGASNMNASASVSPTNASPSRSSKMSAEMKTSGGVYNLNSSSPVPEANYVAQSLGTAFGESAQFNTRTVEFKRGDLQATLVCHYDEKRALKERGIRFERRHPKRNEPEPFPAMPITGCHPPSNWHG